MSKALAQSRRHLIPSLVTTEGNNARFAWEEFFYATIRSEHTRRAYFRSVVKFLAWCSSKAIELPRIAPADVGIYIDALPLAISSKKQVLAGLRHFFDCLVRRHVMILNPALSVRGERYAVLEGKTPEISIKQARQLLHSIDISSPVGLRDKAVICILIYTAARVGAVSKLRVKDFYDAGDQHYLHFMDKGGKSRHIPIRHDLQTLLFRYLQTIDVQSRGNELRPLFCTCSRRSKENSSNAMSAGDIGRMVKRRMALCGLPRRLSPHSFRVTTITDLLEQGVPLEDVQNLAGHADPRTTRLYDRRNKAITRNIVERISI